MNKLSSAIAIALAIYGVPSYSSSTDLMGIYQQSLANDNTFKQAYSTYMANKEALPQAISSLLPSLSGNASYTLNSVNSMNKVTGLRSKDYYDQRSWSINASQPVFNVAAWLAVGQAKYSVKQAQATFNASAQDLMLRASQAYFDVLLGKDTVRFSLAKQRANKRQLDQAEQRFKVGLDAITSVYEAKSAYDSSRAEVISAKNNLINASERLRKLTNHTYKRLSPLRGSRIPLVNPSPNNVDDWVDTSLKQNYQLIASRFAAISARKNISVNSAGHLPSVSFQGNYNKDNNGSARAQFNTDSSNYALSLNLSVPIYQGGLVVSQTKQARYNYQVANEQLDGTRRDTIINTRIAFNTIIDGISKIRADRQSIISAQNSLDSTEAQFKVGTRTMVDVVNAQQNLFQAQTILAQDQYSYINAILRLKFSAGTLNVNDLQKINAWLSTNRSSKKISTKRPRELQRMAYFESLAKKQARAKARAQHQRILLAKAKQSAKKAPSTTKTKINIANKIKQLFKAKNLASKAHASKPMPSKIPSIKKTAKKTKNKYVVQIGSLVNRFTDEAKKATRRVNKVAVVKKQAKKIAVKRPESTLKLATPLPSTRFS